MKKPHFVNNEIYHIYNRGVEKREIFLDDRDRFRFVHDLFEFNDEAPALNVNYYLKRQYIEVQPRYIEKKEKIPRKLLVEILSFCLMPNHYHLLVRQKRENGIVDFMQKLGTGYTMYFNQKYQRVGGLFQGRFKAIMINKESHLLHLPYYIHLNPLDIEFPEWREKELKDFKKAIIFLKNYRWSSFLDYIGKENFPSITSREFLTDILGQPKEYLKETKNWLKEIDLTDLEEIILE
jgi:putative transposase